MLVTLTTAILLLAPPQASDVLLLKPAKVMRHLHKAVKANDQKQIDRAVLALVVMGERGRHNLRRQIKRYRSPVFSHVLSAISQMEPRLRLIAAPLLRSKDPNRRIQGAQALNGSSLALLKKSYAGEKALDVKLALLASISESDEKGSTEFLVSTLSATESRLRIQALAGLLLRRERSVLNVVHTLLGDSDFEVRASAIRFLSVLGNRNSVAFMVKRAEAEQDETVLGAIWSALESLTGESFGGDLKAWQRWLNTET